MAHHKASLPPTSIAAKLRLLEVPLVLLLLQAQVEVSTSATADCELKIPRLASFEPPLGVAPRVVPAIAATGELIVAWQDNESIFVRWFDHDCKGRTDVLQVNRSDSFLTVPGGGLWGVAGLQSRQAVVAWVQAGNVWVRVVDGDLTGGGMSSAVRANGLGQYIRTEVQIVATPKVGSDSMGFAVAWSSFDQDGDGWGIFARRFTTEILSTDQILVRSLGPEVQANVHWRHYQWQPQISWCGSSLWALWTNSTGRSYAAACPGGADGCSNGPWLRHLSWNGSDWGNDTEITFETDEFAGSALTCAGVAREPNDAAVLWLVLNMAGGTVHLKYVPPGRMPSIQTAADITSSIKAPVVETATVSVLATVSSFPTRAQQWFAERRRAGEKSLSSLIEDPLIPGKQSMIATNGLMVLISDDDQATVSTQLLDYGHEHPRVYSRRQVAVGAREVRAVWDFNAGSQLDNRSLVLCWVAGGHSAVSPTSTTSFICARRSVPWLMGQDPVGLELIGTFAAMLLFCVVGGFIMFRQCLPAFCWRRGQGLREPNGRRAIASNLARIRDLREQVQAIPAVPTRQNPSQLLVSGRGGPAWDPSTAPADDTEDGNSPSLPDADRQRNVSGSAPGGDVLSCPCCYEVVVVRVALKPCGHTACRECILRIVEMQNCHICRGAIEGVLPVYI